MFDIIRTGKWNPTKKEYDKYLKREVELCKHNISKGGSSNRAHLLHSERTIAKAMK